MAENRRIRKVVRSRATIEGAGVHLHRAIGFGDPTLCDPFLLFDDFRSDRPEHYLKGFPWHPHRGIETITYVLRGDVERGDDCRRGRHGAEPGRPCHGIDVGGANRPEHVRRAQPDDAGRKRGDRRGAEFSVYVSGQFGDGAGAEAEVCAGAGGADGGVDHTVPRRVDGEMVTPRLFPARYKNGNTSPVLGYR